MYEEVLILLGLKDVEEETRNRIETIIGITERRLRVILGMLDEVPDSLSHIVSEVAVVRYNRIASEGLSSHSVEGETMAWSENDFKPYQDEIQAYLDAQEDPKTSTGRVRFI